jgi:hypothetical protein
MLLSHSTIIYLENSCCIRLTFVSNYHPGDEVIFINDHCIEVILKWLLQILLFGFSRV